MAEAGRVLTLPRYRTVMRAALTLALALLSVASARTAFWLRPPGTPAELERTLTAAKQAGFTDVLIEGFYHGRTIWPSRVAPMKTNYDALKTTMDFARREGLNVSVWFETLYWRPADKFGIPVTPLWRDEWATRTREGFTSLQLSPLGFVDPAEPGVGDTLEALVREFTSLYRDAGLHLDYLRYPREDAFGYHPALLEAFERETGRDARTLIPSGSQSGTASPEERRWVELRRDAITSLANRLTGAYRDVGGRGMTSAAVFHSNDPLQDWRSWKGLDVAMPMLYLPANYAGLYPFMLLPFPKGERVWPGVQVGAGYQPLEQQLQTIRNLGYPNVAVFNWKP